MNSLFKIIAEIERENHCEITEEIDLVTDLRYDSLKFIQLISNIEEAFDIEFDIDDIEIEKLRSMKSLMLIIETKSKEKKNG